MERVPHNSSIDTAHSETRSATCEDRTRSPDRFLTALDPRRVQQLQQSFATDLAPRTSIEQFLVQRAAQAAAFVEHAGACEVAMATGFVVDDPSAVISGLPSEIPTVWSKQIDLVRKLKLLTLARKFSASHWRQFRTALQEFRKHSQWNSSESRREFVPQCPTEEECFERLRQRFSDPDWACPGCGQPHGCWLPSRAVWECGRCRRQVGLRWGLPVENSALRLKIWAHAFLILRENPQLPTTRLAELLSIRRTDTARRIRRKLLPLLETPEKMGGLIPC